MLTWQCHLFDELSAAQLYQLMKLRVDVFVVEQNCPYPELDNNDIQNDVYHLIGKYNEEIVAYARLLPAGLTYPHVSIGRVVTKKSVRGGKLGHQLLEQAITKCQSSWPDCTIDIGAQEHLVAFYQQHGFEAISSLYLEDGIPHIDMRRI
ncbi:GNAT family N-acetyltransferase [Vibrio sp. 10N.286.49.B3]|uniref:GNAT family N-acetyltransferase n=1 Tax=Vibrio sp. 10N.286.49.B3 TaxID=1880855 RepID=UPI000C816EEB|nr:GNAT family N-acetyltransferase [Vibrio sp. 10N.286.49.B3]PMH42563.1 GNAT family N-acetyltransferase [Vibrio sp. 10N.286.49.B3]